MFRIKRLYTYMLQSFSLQLIVTFLICLFILLMQFLWRYVDEMVGKGIELPILGEFFIYAALFLMPQAFPLSILLASLMTFGNMAERLELLAIKAAGVSLLRVMKPLIILVCFTTVASFLFQDIVTPKAQVKMWALLNSIRNTSPELEIPEGFFYEIESRSILARKKEKDTGALLDVTIYDYSRGTNDASIIVADSARLRMTDDKLYLVLSLFRGEQFENLQSNTVNAKNIPYRREAFATKDVLIPFDTNFKRQDESFYQNSYAGKNLAELQYAMDSIRTNLDSMRLQDTRHLAYREERENRGNIVLDKKEQDIPESNFNPDSIYRNLTLQEKTRVVDYTVKQLTQIQSEFKRRKEDILNQQSSLWRHGTEWHGKFSLSFTCLIFFFIGAPLGAIIRKGGFGMPVVSSVLLFILYYIINTIGTKMAKTGAWDIWQGAWLSSFVLSPLGAFLTYKATIDSAALNADAYKNVFKKIFAITDKNRTIARKEFVVNDPDYVSIHTQLDELTQSSYSLEKDLKKRPGYVAFWLDKSFLSVAPFVEKLESIIEKLKDSQDNLVIHKISSYPVISSNKGNNPFRSKYIRIFFMLLFPIGLIIYLITLGKRKKLKENIQVIVKLNAELKEITTKYI